MAKVKEIKNRIDWKMALKGIEIRQFTSVDHCALV